MHYIAYILSCNTICAHKYLRMHMEIKYEIKKIIEDSDKIMNRC